MSRTHDPMPENTVPETASRSGYDSTAEMARGKTREAAGKLVQDDNMEREGEMEQASADAREKEILKPWQRARDAS
ncbi:MAG: hypothetical protein ACRD0C_02800 [Acidimicrobiia bacterium]